MYLTVGRTVNRFDRPGSSPRNNARNVTFSSKGEPPLAPEARGRRMEEGAQGSHDHTSVRKNLTTGRLTARQTVSVSIRILL
jgi:hypothetical protein